jgi:outer membrane usher protein FimD/PapC
VWVAPDNYGETSFYTEGNVTVPLPHDYSVVAHAGYSFGDYWKKGAGEYLDYSVGVNKNLGNFAANLKYVNSNDYGDASVGRNAWIFTISTTLPWAE